MLLQDQARYYAHLARIRKFAAEVERNSSGKSWEEDYENACKLYQEELSSFATKISQYLATWKETKIFLKILSVQSFFIEEFKEKFVNQIKDFVFGQFKQIQPIEQDVQLLMQNLPYKGLIVNSIQHSFRDLFEDLVSNKNFLDIKIRLNHYRNIYNYLVHNGEIVDSFFFENFDSAISEFNRLLNKEFPQRITNTLHDMNDIKRSLILFPHYKKAILENLFENCEKFFKTTEDALFACKYIPCNSSYKSSFIHWFNEIRTKSASKSDLCIESIESQICIQLGNLKLDNKKFEKDSRNADSNKLFSKKRKNSFEFTTDQMDLSEYLIP